MKDPQMTMDPRSVSAYAVYKGLVPELKTYLDTSEGTNASRRKKARRRNRKRAGAKDGLKDEGKAAAEEILPTNKKQVEVPKGVKNNSEKEGKNKNGVVHSTPHSSSDNANTTPNGNGEQKKKKKRKKKNKSKGEKAANNVTAATQESVYASDDDEEQISVPHKKAKTLKERELVPNPFAAKMLNGNAKSVGKAANDTPAKRLSSVKNQKALTVPSSLANQLSNNANNVNAKSNKKKSLNDKTPVTSTSAKGVAAAPEIKGKGKNKKVEGPHHPSIVTGASYKVESKVPPPDAKQAFHPKRVEDSIEQGKAVLDWMIHPVTSDEFMKKYFEKKPLLIKRLHEESKDFYKSILTTQGLDDILRRNVLKYGVNLDITSYTDGVRETLSENMQGRVRPAVVWDYYNNGCSLRMLNPQTYVQRLWRMNAALQEWFGSFVGANMYLTPPESQGFAPHYDDIEAFILQIEGKKQWKVYAPRKENEKLPRFSSSNFSEAKDNIGEPIIDVTLEEGDLLYFPRGFIHQAKTVDGEHSLHITVSCHQLNTYGDLLKHHVNHALEKLIASDVQFRQGLPSDYLSYMGIGHENSRDKEIIKKRETFSKTVGSLVAKLAKQPSDFAADAMGKKFIWDSLPPYLGPKERETCVLEDGEFMQNGRVFNRVEFGPEVEVKLIRKNCVRLMVEEGLVKLYYSSENSMVYHDEDAQYLELSVELAPTVNHLISQYPEYTKIEDLPLSSDEIGQKIQVISDLWERGLIFTKKPLEACDIDEDFDMDGSDSDFNDGSNHDDDDVESIDLSELPEDSEDDEDTDEYYDTSLMGSELVSDSSSLGSSDNEVDDGQADNDYFAAGFDFGGEEEEEESEEDGEIDSEEGYGEGEVEEEEEEEVDEDEFDLMDKMEESDDDED